MSDSGLTSSDSIPKAVGIPLILAGLLVLSGCWVSSINPLYEEWSVRHPVEDHDVVFDESLIGSWSLTEDKCTTQLVIAAIDDRKVYDLQLISHGDGCGDDQSHREARLVKLDLHYFLDVSPIADDVCDMCLAKHDILLVKSDKTTLGLTPIDSDG